MSTTEEVSLRSWIEAPWFKGASRVTMLVGGFFMPIVGGLIVAQLARVSTVETALVEVQQAQVDRADIADRRAQDDEHFRGEVRRDIDVVQGDLKDVNRGIDTLQTDVATIKGILEGMQRRDVALRSLFPPAAVSP